jgi:hypothetical protein
VPFLTAVNNDMSNLNLPSNVKYDSNTGGYFITNTQGQTLRVAASTQDQLDSYVNSVNTGTPITVTTTSPITGNPNTQTFDPTTIYKDNADSASRLDAMTAVKRKTGLIGNADGSYYDLRTNQTLTREQADAKVAAAGLPPESLNLVTPRSSPAYNSAQASLDNNVNLPSNLGGTVPPATPVQSPTGPGTDKTVTDSVPAPAASAVTPTTDAPLPPDGDEALAAAQAAQDVADLQVAAESATPVDPYTEGLLLEQEQLRQFQADEDLNARLDRAADVDLANSGDAAAEAAAREREAADLRIASESATPVNPALVSALDPNEFGAQAVAGDADTAEASNAANQAAVGRGLAQKQAVLAAQKKMANNGDWRVRLSLAPGATYLYNAPSPGILEPLKVTDGIVFPYMPKIETNYKAEYDTYNLTHSNYRGYFYKGSYTDTVNLTATFTAQDSAEATYLLAVIHFFKSITKMFYGQDAERGAPPPMVYLTGLGQYQFSAHPCVVNNFQLNLPNDVDYIRARSVNINGANLLTRRTKQDLPTNPVSGAVQRLQNLFSSQRINKGAIDARPAPPTLGLNQPTYVPTKMDISLTLYPIQSRQQVSREFSLKGYANGDLLKKGFW